MFHHGISTSLIWLIDFEVVFESLTLQTLFFVLRRISCKNAFCIVSWSRNFVLKLTRDVFDPQVGGWAWKKFVCRCHWTRPHTDAFRFGGFLEPVSHISEIFEFLLRHFSRLLFLLCLWGSPSIKLSSNWSKDKFRRISLCVTDEWWVYNIQYLS